MGKRLTVFDFDYDTNFVASNLQSWPIAQALKKLQMYENLGTVEELAELVEAKRDGRLVALPCKVGDTVYSTEHKYPLRIDAIVIHNQRRRPHDIFH